MCISAFTDDADQDLKRAEALDRVLNKYNSTIRSNVGNYIITLVLLRDLFTYLVLSCLKFVFSYRAFPLRGQSGEYAMKGRPLVATIFNASEFLG